MALKKIQKDLHKRDSDYAIRQHEYTDYNVWKPDDEAQQHVATSWQRAQQAMSTGRIRSVMIGVGVVIAIAILGLLILAAYYFNQGFFKAERVGIAATAVEQTASNQLVEITFTMTNDNRATLHNAQLHVHYGPYFTPAAQEQLTTLSNRSGVFDLGELAGGEVRDVVLVGRFSGPAQETDSVRAVFGYTPEKSSTVYEQEAVHTVTITSSAAHIDVRASKEGVEGNLYNMDFAVRNTSTQDIENVKFVVAYPATFQPVHHEPATISDGAWLLERLPAQQETTFRLQGTLNAKEGTTVNFDTQLATQADGGTQAVYAVRDHAVRMVQSPIRITQTVSSKDNIAYAGERPQYTVAFRNNSNRPLRDVVLQVALDGRLIDEREITVSDGGFYDAATKTITWRASGLAALRLLNPGDEGNTTFNVPVVERIPVAAADDTRFAITTVATIDSEDMPGELRQNKSVRSNTAVVKIGSKMLFDVAVTPVEAGAHPPQTGKKTLYDIAWQVGSVNNDAEDVVITSALPAGVTWEDVIDGEEQGLVFNERTNEITWTLGRVQHGIGILAPHRRVRFRVGVTPGVNQSLHEVIIMQEAMLTGSDVFTQAAIAHPVRRVSAAEVRE